MLSVIGTHFQETAGVVQHPCRRHLGHDDRDDDRDDHQPNDYQSVVTFCHSTSFLLQGYPVQPARSIYELEACELTFNSSCLDLRGRTATIESARSYPVLEERDFFFGFQLARQPLWVRISLAFICMVREGRADNKS